MSPHKNFGAGEAKSHAQLHLDSEYDWTKLIEGTLKRAAMGHINLQEAMLMLLRPLGSQLDPSNREREPMELIRPGERLSPEVNSTRLCLN